MSIKVINTYPKYENTGERKAALKRTYVVVQRTIYSESKKKTANQK